MTGQIHLIDAQRQLVAKHEPPDDSEAALPRLLADHPSLPVGDQTATAPAGTDAK